MKIRIIIPAILAGAIYLIQCSNAYDNTDRNLLLLGQSQPVYQDLSRSNTYAGTRPYDYYFIDTSTYTNLQYTLDLGVSTKKVYFIFTNTDTGNGTTYPKINAVNPATLQELVPATAEANPPKPDPAAGIISGHGDKREVSEFNRNPFAFVNKINPVNMLLNIIPPAGPSYSTAKGDSYSFYMDSNINNTTPARCRKVVYNPSNGKTLSIWVANDCWWETIPHTKSYWVTQTMVDNLADKFLNTGNNDIYHWVTNIFGAEWGSHTVPELIGTTNEITILLCDIPDDPSGAVVLGYFWAKDNFKRTYLSYSNEKIMFYIDAVIFATPDAGAWDITDSQPSLIISTLAHEFQHMIHFYQKTVLRTNGTATEAWIDEMCSMATEDLVADKLGTKGPRGVDSTNLLYSDGSAGPTRNTEGWLPLYNYINEFSPVTWYSNQLISYALNYALGAYLGRNYGGAAFFGAVVQSSFTDYTAIENAMKKYGSTDDFGTMLRKWAVANLLSDSTTAENPYRYNSGTWFVSDTSPATIQYKLGSINLYNYDYVYDKTKPAYTGPYIYLTMPTITMQPATNVYYEAGNGITGKKTWNISLTGAVRMTVVIK